MSKSMQTQNRRALVTGASSGIGRELCRHFAADGIDLVVVARRQERLEELAEALQAEYDIDVRVEPCDLADAEARTALFERLDADDVNVDYLVNNAGFGSNGPFHELDRVRELDQVEVNVVALTDLTHRFLPGMLARGFGRILNIASTAAFQPGPYMSVYYATKAYVLSFTEGIAHELEGTGVTATAHCPGATSTEFAEEASNDDTLLFKSGVATVESVAEHAYLSMQRGKTVAIPGLKNKFGATMVRFSPRKLVRSIAARLNR
ncbi:SDR family oxidoreductase [Persicimonas caeni]|uniref:SDR family oxidoreductase n=1 Tax=Persicimonas caeni TaxID=2292766 RepID=A0A4Y6Q005_PERCE|nr:SDR family oxidoreductase [Persicimonas caeni]QDG53906.1 SDR family oxidoreductase [Persicimonas caeni]QED35127.1 SDR family oxidoreductase [Persicimonas caeni]